MSNTDFRQFLVDAYSAADAMMKAGTVFYIWHADSEEYDFRGTAHDIDRPSRSREHPTMKPVELFEYQMLNNTKGDDLVLDNFLG